MSIKFICSCGKHLRARDEMAARRSMCPRCGQPVGIPSMRPTHAGTAAAPLTPQDRRRLNRDKPRAAVGREDEPEALATDSPSLTLPARPHAPKDTPRPRKPKTRRSRQMEQHWYQCLVYPVLNSRRILSLALILSVWMAGIVLAIPKLPPWDAMSLQDGFPWIASVFGLVLMAAYAYATVECALISALAGQGSGSYWPGWRDGLSSKSGLRWLFCFFAGPIVLVVIAAYYWIYGGDFTGLDWVILAELGVAAAAYWLLAIVSASERNRLLDANPLRVALLVHRLKLRAIVPVLIAPALLVSHALLALLALATLHENIVAGWLLLAGCWISGLTWAAFLFRLLGVWCYRVPPESALR
ncbi:MAG: hypothetical protein ACYC3I_10040 [Gemmataceae bacterium]